VNFRSVQNRHICSTEFKPSWEWEGEVKFLPPKKMLVSVYYTWLGFVTADTGQRSNQRFLNFDL
jgi:hypothetical protein